MGLRSRLAVFFVAITVVPLTVATVVLQVQLERRLGQVTVGELQGAGTAARLAVNAARDRAGDLATDLGRTRLAPLLARGDAPAIQRVINRSVAAVPDRASFIVVVNAEKDIVGQYDAGAVFPVGADVASLPEAARMIIDRESVPGLLAETREIRGEGNELLGWVAAGWWADSTLLAHIPTPQGAALLWDGTVMAATGADAPAVPTGDLPRSGELRELEINGRRVDATAVTLADEPQTRFPLLLLWQPHRQSLRILPLLIVLVAAVAIASWVGWVLAGGIVAPIRRAARVARAVAAGDLEQRLEPTGGRELADLAGALNAMSRELQERMADVERSRDELRQSLSRLGQTLSSSLDLDRTLAVVVETAIETLGGDRGMLWLFTPERDALYVKVGRGVGQHVMRLPIGAGVAGHVARVGGALRLPADRDVISFPSSDEPTARHELAVPMVGRGRVLGVLTILSDSEELAYSQDDLDTLRSFAAQASVAMENVMLHQEAQRLSVTDPLTGLWNFRYFQLQADRELESAARFERPLSLLIIDLDHFKTINDRFGHQVGDDVLVEVARRIQAATRVPDVVARYGGEEFVVLLPGTDLRGAMATAERIRTAVGASKIAITTAQDIAPMGVTCSIGVSEHPMHGTTVAGLLRSADAAMYLAKTQGRDRVVAAGSGGQDQNGNRVSGASTNR